MIWLAEHRLPTPGLVDNRCSNNYWLDGQILKLGKYLHELSLLQMPICSFSHRIQETHCHSGQPHRTSMDIKGLGKKGSGHVTHNLSLELENQIKKKKFQVDRSDVGDKQFSLVTQEQWDKVSVLSTGIISKIPFMGGNAAN